jgi:hypothetical protein
MKLENNAFVSVENTHCGLIFDDSKNIKYPLKYYNVINNIGVEIKNNCSYYGYVYKGEIKLDINNNIINLKKEMYFSVSGNISLLPTIGSMILVEVYHEHGQYKKNNYTAMNQFGIIESIGRLKYIDGCTDSILIHPVKMGDPCLNYLHFPTNIVQTPHTHPSHRIGCVAKGYGTCITPFGNLPLIEGNIFVIKEWDGLTYANGLDGNEYEIGNHCFYTTDSAMDVIAFHPDSDFGALDEDHPMINKTIVKGISAKNIEEIRTK